MMKYRIFTVTLVCFCACALAENVPVGDSQPSSETGIRPDTGASDQGTGPPPDSLSSGEPNGGASNQDAGIHPPDSSSSDSATKADSGAMNTRLIGWASIPECGPNGTTGGGDGKPTITVTSGDTLKDALTSSGALIIAVSGQIKTPGSISGVRDKTLIGINNAEIIEGIRLEGARNVVIKNIKFRDGSDDTFELSGCTCIWFDHCEFIDGQGGNLDIVHASDLVTVSWSRFYYTRGHSHMFSNLCGSLQPRHEDEGKINITFHHNWWGAGVKGRAPRVRYGKVHVFNNYYHYEKVSGDDGETYCIGAGYRSKLLVENNYFDESKYPIVWILDIGTAEVVERGNTYVNTGDVVIRGSSFMPPYNYSMDPAAQIKGIVTAGAGVQ